jgi:hypothetical protein
MPDIKIKSKTSKTGKNKNKLSKQSNITTKDTKVYLNKSFSSFLVLLIRSSVAFEKYWSLFFSDVFIFSGRLRSRKKQINFLRYHMDLMIFPT